MSMLRAQVTDRINAAVSRADTTRTVIIDSRAIARAPSCFAECFGGGTAVIIADKNTYSAAGKAVMEAFTSNGRTTVHRPLIIEDGDLCADYRFVDKIDAYLRSIDAIPVAVGSGTINDLVKLSAHHCDRPYMVVATAASMDGYTAFGASITKDGYKQTMTCPAPTALIADMEVIENAPDGMNASGYADLIAKIPAGADWIVADALGIEPIHQEAWSLVQSDLRVRIENPAGIRNKDGNSLLMLMEGLIMSGLAMQVAQSSRPASGAEHQFSHLWDMEHHVHDGIAPSHGTKVGIGSICSEALYELALDLTSEEIQFASDHVGEWWEDWPAIEAEIRDSFKDAAVVEEVVEQSRAKYVDAATLSKRLHLLRYIWIDLKAALREQLLGARTIQAMIQSAGAPSLPEEIGIDRARLSDSYTRARMFRKRYTVLDLALECGAWRKCQDSLFGPGGFWNPVNSQDDARS